jgi:hypothetical protein
MKETIWEIGAVYTNKHNGKQIVVDSNKMTDEGYLLWDAYYLPRAEKGKYEFSKCLSDHDEKHWVKNTISKPKGRVIKQTKFTKVRMLRREGDEEE